MSDSRLSVQYDIKEPVELSALSAAFAGLSRQYSNFIRNYTSEELADEEVVLYVTKIESNCIWTELAPYAALGLTAIQIVDWHNALKEFTDSLDVYFQYFKTTTPNMLGKIGKRDAEDFRDFLAAVAENNTGEINLGLVQYDKETGKRTNALAYTYKPKEINDAFRGVTDYLSKIETKDSNLHEKVLLYLPQLNVDVHKSTGRTADKGVIESISTSPLPVYWQSEMDSRRVKTQSVNPHNVSYIVDVSVQTKKGKALAYSVLRLHDIIPDEAT